MYRIRIKNYFYHIVDIFQNPYLLLFLIKKYFFYFILGKKTKRIILKGKIVNPSLDKTFIRWGDGETNSFLGITFSFEKSSYFLRKNFSKIFKYNGNKILLGLPLEFILESEEKTKYINIWRTTRIIFNSQLNLFKDYGDAFFFRNIGNVNNFIDFYKGKKLFLISNKNTLDKVKNKINFCGSFEIPYRNSSSNYFKIKLKILKSLKELSINNEDLIIIISAGPFAKILSYEFTLENGYICHDVGAFFDIYL